MQFFEKYFKNIFAVSKNLDNGLTLVYNGGTWDLV